MTDTYFDELGIAWRANVPDVDELTIRLKASLRRRIFVTRASIALEAALTIFGIAFGAFWTWKGLSGQASWRYTVTGLLTIAVTACAAASSLWILRGESGGSSSLTSMIDLRISWAERSLRRVRVIYLICAASALYMAAMWFVHPAVGRLSPEIAHRRLLLGTAFMAIWVGAWTIWAITRRDKAHQELAKFQHLKRLFAAG